MRHGKRSVLTTEDINAALRLRNVEARPSRSARRASRPRVLASRTSLQPPCVSHGLLLRAAAALRRPLVR